MSGLLPPSILVSLTPGALIWSVYPKKNIQTPRSDLTPAAVYGTALRRDRAG